MEFNSWSKQLAESQAEKGQPVIYINEISLKELRKSAGITQEELGERAELNYKFIGELERGRVNVSLDSIVKIAAALRIKTGDLFSKERIPIQKIIVKEKGPFSQFSSQDLQLIKKALRLLNRTFSKV
ncbi:MAG: helix-turn-helix transcriptional regulator [Nitrospirae bacterium]|nr:helix-turn-helix transcriptional regulator [Nitrospirota bacterium]